MTDTDATVVTIVRDATVAEKSKKLHTPILLYLGGLLASSTVLTAAAISALKDVQPYSDWQRALCGFLFWMAWTILTATIGAAFIQRRLAKKVTETDGWSDIAIFAPALLGFLAALQIIGFAASRHHPFHFFF